MTTKGYMSDFYKQFELLNKKLDKANATIFNMSLTISELNNNIKNQEKIIQQKDKTIEQLVEEIERLKNQINKNSNNSSKPSSTNIVTPRKKTGANLYNYRTETKNKIGGQYGHKGSNLDKKETEKLIEEGRVKVKTITHTIKGDSSKEPIVKYRFELDITPYTENLLTKINTFLQIS